MKRTWLPAVLSFVPLFFSAASSSAGEPGYDWTGFYLGGHAGVLAGQTHVRDPAGAPLFGGDVATPGFVAGLQAGYDRQFAPNWLVGGEGQYSWLGSNQLHAVFPGVLVYNNNQRGLGSITGRVGYTWGPGLAYIKGGYAYSDNRETLTFAGVPIAFTLDHTHTNGYTIGAGVEYMFAQNFSAKLEYQYYDFGRSAFVAPIAFVPFGAFRVDEHTVKAGLNYRFNWGGPVVARY